MRCHRKNITIINNKIDYDKLAQAIVKAQQEAEKQKEIEKNELEEKRREVIIKNRLHNLNCTEDFDEKGEPKNKKAKIKLVWNFICAKESDLKDISIIDSSINSIVSLFFAALEWLLYIITFALLVFFFLDISKFVGTCIDKTLEWKHLLSAVDFLVYGFVSFIFSRLILRTLKINCKYNKDSHYMMSLFAVIVSIIAIIVAIVLE